MSSALLKFCVTFCIVSVYVWYVLTGTQCQATEQAENQADVYPLRQTVCMMYCMTLHKTYLCEKDYTYSKANIEVRNHTPPAKAR